MWDEEQHAFVSYRCANRWHLMGKDAPFEQKDLKDGEMRYYCSEQCMNEDLARMLLEKAIRDKKNNDNTNIPDRQVS